MPHLRVRIGCVVLAVIMSAVTYYFVEPRLRWGRYGGFKAAGLLSVMIIIGVTGYSIERHEGYTARMDDPEQPVIDAINSRLKEDNERCLQEIPNWKRSWHMYITQCHFQRPSGKNTIAVIGDSYAGHLYPGLAAKSKQNEGIVIFPSQCAIPLIGLKVKGTDTLLSEGFEYILRHNNITKVVLSNSAGCSWHNVIDLQNQNNHDFDSILHNGFVRTYDVLTKAGKQVYVVAPGTSSWGNNWLKCKSSVVKRPGNISLFFSSKIKSCSLKQTALVERKYIDNWDRVAHESAKGYKNVHFINLEEVFCKNGTCSMLDNAGNMLFMDRGHLNLRGSIYVAPFIFEKLRDSL